MAILANFKEAKTVETGSYDAELIRIEEINTQFGKNWRWVFQVSDPEKGEVEISGMTSRNFSQNSKAGGWVMIMLGNKKPGTQFDLEQLIGCYVKVHVEKTTKDDGKEYSNVKSVLSLINNTNSFLPKELKEDIPF